ncbi:hypothetical protein CAPTEDRAFT_211837 [Capitella teleta]|uniref:DNA-directed RNA polymerase subunit n=1 Tax=Capitella teleta TaxID=283909 RepID=R7UC67_CAPTE|nr:hypothetical protein CAPTEDRAFT_211837 [Capitella teleta]|eukprot:ELU01383.1 hypothetical protein CAPTEDRAFT_211837 [Capitella teleta]
MSSEKDVEFCPECAAILPLPDKREFVTCFCCKFTIPIKDFDGIEIKSKIIFNKRKTKNAGLSSEDQAAGPTVDRQCAKCGNDGMTYATRQTRSADEGQTVFYSCPKCGFQESEFS